MVGIAQSISYEYEYLVAFNQPIGNLILDQSELIERLYLDICVEWLCVFSVLQ